MHFGLLGPLAVVDDGRDLAPTAPKQRQVLALLLLDANRVVPMSRFVAELWELAPPSAVAAVQTYVKQLRQLFGGAGGRGADRVLTRDRGYLLRVGAGELDLDVFRTAVNLARQQLDGGQVQRAAETLRTALALWHGQPLLDVSCGPALAAAVEALEAQRLEAIRLRVDADLRLGRHGELVGELTGLLNRYPADEQVASQLVLALYRSGRQADALTILRSLRERLRLDGCGDPGPALDQLYLDLLTGAPWLEPAVPASPPLALDAAANCVGRCAGGEASDGI